ncbi:NTP transferase domain-containing protein [Candidatus Sumerlaeota bacterium]|nr:NTP transferase domain-containing protein [Candidatus Sumerlaeota bacterium]
MGTPKELVRLHDGRMMVQHVVAALRPISSTILLSVGTEPSREQSSLGLPVLLDKAPFEGPLFAIGHVLRELPDRELLFVCCDQPLLQADLLKRLLTEETDRRPAFFISARERDIFPFPAYIPSTAQISLLADIDSGARSLRQWAMTHTFHLVHLDEGDASSLRSFNDMGALIRSGLMAAPPPSGSV